MAFVTIRLRCALGHRMQRDVPMTHALMPVDLAEDGEASVVEPLARPVGGVADGVEAA